MNSTLRILGCLFLGTAFVTTGTSQVTEKAKTPTVRESHPSLKAAYGEAKGIGAEKGVMRRDPSDIIKVGDLYYVWYSKGKIAPGYDATVWYATSPDGHTWTEKGMALAKGESGGWDGASVFTPNILVAKQRYWLFYTGTSRAYKKAFSPDSKIGVAVSDSPDGPWERVSDKPVITNSDDPDKFDSHLIDDACLIVRGGKYWCHFKGRQLGKGPGQTKMGVAIADEPQGPYVKHENNPVIPGNHEVLIWPQGSGVAALIGTTGPKEITRSILYSENGIDFSKTHNLTAVPHAGGAFRPEAFTDSGEGKQIQWGVHIGRKKGFLPFIERFDLEQNPQDAKPAGVTAEQFGRREAPTTAKSKQPPKYQDSVPSPTLSSVKYGPHNRNIMDFWRAESETPTPLVFVIHGGGWRGGSKERIHKFVDTQALLNKGISVAAINYRYTTQAGKVTPPVRVPLHDAARALQFVRSKAKEWNIDKQRIGAAGGSAGACSSLWLAFHDDLANISSDDPIARESSRLWCAAVVNPQTSLDPQQMKQWIPNSKYGAHAFGKQDFSEFLAERETILPWIKEYSPYALVTKDDPVVYMMYGNRPAIGKPAKDPTHSANFGVKLQEHCESVGTDCELAYPGAADVRQSPTAFLIETLTGQHRLD